MEVRRSFANVLDKPTLEVLVVFLHVVLFVFGEGGGMC